MPDLIDRAQEEEERQRSEAIESQLAKGAAVNHESHSFCGCGNRIPRARQLAVPGTPWCVFCAEARERTRRLHRTVYA